MIKKLKQRIFLLIMVSLSVIILGIIVLTTPIITIVFTGVILGIILIVVGIFTIINFHHNDLSYKVKVK